VVQAVRVGLGHQAHQDLRVEVVRFEQVFRDLRVALLFLVHREDLAVLSDLGDRGVDHFLGVQVFQVLQGLQEVRAVQRDQEDRSGKVCMAVESRVHMEELGAFPAFQAFQELQADQASLGAQRAH
jgi:hypothetical protein